MFIQADAVRLPFADDTFDLVFTSPPYTDARTYGIGAQRKCGEWISWMLRVVDECVRVTRGLVLINCAGVTRDWCYQPGPEGLLYEWWKRGGRAWRPAFWHRVGIPGSGGKQWLRADVEYVLAFTSCQGAIPWSDNTANGHPPKWAPGGEMSYRNEEGARKNDDDPWGKRGRGNNLGGRKVNGEKNVGTHKAKHGKDVNGKKKITRRVSQGHGPDGDTRQDDTYVPPVLANPGVLVEPEMTADEILARWLAETGADDVPNCIKNIKVGGGIMGHKLCHVSEAPFPEKLAEWFIRGWCPPAGRVLDPFVGSGTTVAAATKLGRKGIGCDIRFNQCKLAARRCAEIQTELFQ